jgi:hypothetical protein
MRMNGNSCSRSKGLTETRMDFSRRKLPKEAVTDMRLCMIESVRPYALMLAPAYVYMKVNEKFVAVKAPLDFFTPEELERLKPLGSFFFPSCVDAALRYRETARAVRSLLAWEPKPAKGGAAVLPPAPYELSDALLRLLAPLWGAQAAIEPFFVSTFANELCELLPGDLLKSARDRDVVGYERALLVSGWAVLLALLLGHADLAYLNRLRLGVFREAVGADPAGFAPEITEEASAIHAAHGTRALPSGHFATRASRAGAKLAGRMGRLRELAQAAGQSAPSVFGEGGFVDA